MFSLQLASSLQERTLSACSICCLCSKPCTLNNCFCKFETMLAACWLQCSLRRLLACIACYNSLTELLCQER